MADKEPVNKKGGSATIENDDPILQGVDRVQTPEKVESHIAPETQDGPEDTHTKTNIHLGGRDEEGIGTGPQEDETEAPGQTLEPLDLSSQQKQTGEENFNEDTTNLYEPSGIITPEDPEFLSSGRAQPQVDIQGQQINRQAIETIDGVAGPQSIETLELDDGENGPPVTGPVDLGATDEDVSADFTVADLLSNANDPDSDDLFVSDVAIDPAYGVIIDNGDGTYTFEPAPDFFGDDLPITYTISDGTYTIPGTAIIDVLPVNDPPTSADNEAITPEDTSITFNLADFAFSDIENDSFDHITITSLPENGVLFFNGSPVSEGDDIPSAALNQLVFLPDEDEHGEDYATFNFTVSDGTDDSGEYTFSIDVTPVNDPPTSADEEAVIDEDTSYNFGLVDFAFSDIDGDEFDHITITTLPDNGELTFDGNPVSEGDEISPEDFDLLLFTPVPNENGDDYATFNFTVNDGTTDSGEYTFSIDVTSVNDPPIAEDDENEGPEDTQQVGNVLENDSDIDGTIEVKDPGIYDTDHGSITINVDGSYIYTPNDDYNGSDSFEYTIVDDEGAEATATLNLTITPVADPPTSENNEISTPEDIPYGFSPADFVFNDVDGDSLDHITITQLPVNGELTLYGNPVSEGDNINPGDIPNLLYTPPENMSGENIGDFKFTVNDGTEDSAVYDFSIDVTPVADTPDLCLLGEIPETSGLYDISSGGIVTISATYYNAVADVTLFKNSHGYYVADSDGNPIGGAIIQDRADEGGNFDITFNTDDYPGGVTLGFFIVPDGDTQNLDLSDGDPVTFDFIDGKWVPFVDGVAINGAPKLWTHFTASESLPAFFSDPALNADNYDHLVNNEILGNQNWEDIVNGGDHDFSDLNALIQVTLQTCDDINTQGLEGTIIPVPEILTALTDTDGSETLGVVISNIPEGVIFSDDLGHEFTATDIDHDVDVSDWNLHALKVFSPVGQDDFTVQVTSTATENENGDEASATLNINVDILHAPETAVVDLGATPEDTSFNFTAADLLVNASDADGDDLFVSNVAIDPIYGSIIDNGDDTYTFVPAENYSGNDLPITYDIFDGLTTTNGSAIIDVTPVADTPDLQLLGEIPETSGLYDISSGGIVTISATYYNAVADVTLFKNSHGYYVADSDGNPIGGAIIQDRADEGGNFDITFNTDDYPGGVTLGFFIVPDGDTQNLDLSDGDPVTFDFIDGKWVPFVDGVAINGAPKLWTHFTASESLPAFFSDPALNADNYDHLVNNEILGNQNWEDIVNGGDHDFSDLNALIQVTLQTSGDIDVQGDEGTEIPVPEILTALTDTDGSETLGVVISNIPEGVIFSDDLGHDFTATDIDNDVDVSDWNLHALKVFSPVGQDDFTVQVTSTATETENGDEASTIRNINIDIVLAPEVLPLALNAEIAPLAADNENPVAEDDESAGNQDEVQIGNVLANDSDVDGTFEIKEPGTYNTDNGSITISADGSFEYTPNEGYVGSDSYEYTIIDDDGAEAIATLNLTVNALEEIIVGTEANDVLIGGDRNDTFIMGALEGDDFINAGSGETWTDVIELKGFSGLDHEVGWTLVLDSGTVQLTDDENGEMLLSQDADGTITFDDGGSITFENVEKIVW